MLAPYASAPGAGEPLASRDRFVAELREACIGRSGYAAGKLGVTERAWLRYPMLAGGELDATKRRAFELALAHTSMRAAGVFPDEPAFLARWAERYIEHVRQLDSIGVFTNAAGETLELLAFHRLETGRAVDCKDQQPDRSSPSKDERCYLEAFRDRNLLLICPFGKFLAERAERETFEAVWAKTGKRWFYPRSVQALEPPYGFAPRTQSRYRTALDLLEDLEYQVAEREFDVAMIAAGGLGIPLASFVKSQGRIGISLGGHLQVMFGVLGARWRHKQSWRDRYFNDAWVDLPQRYLPGPSDSSENYW